MSDRVIFELFVIPNPLFGLCCNNFAIIILIVLCLTFMFVEFEMLIKLHHPSTNYFSWYFIWQDSIFILGDYCDCNNHNDWISVGFLFFDND